VLKPEPDASQSTMIDLSKSGSYSTDAEVSVAFKVSKVVAASGDHRKDSRLSSYVSGAAMSSYA
jgi:hypothetical protein